MSRAQVSSPTVLPTLFMVLVIDLLIANAVVSVLGAPSVLVFPGALAIGALLVLMAGAIFGAISR